MKSEATRSQSQTRSSPWLADVDVITRSPLDEDMRVDVCIIGGGIAGMTTAYLLACEGASVAVVERRAIGSGETGRTTAHLTNAMDDGLSDLADAFGLDAMRLIVESHGAAIDSIETIAGREGISCDFERLDGYLFLPPHGALSVLETELECARAIGWDAVEMIARAPLPSFDTGPCLRFPRQAQFHPMKYLAGLVSAFEKRHGRVYTDTTVQTVSGGSRPCVRAESGCRIQAEAIVVATNAPIHDNLQIHFKQVPYRTYVVGMRVERGAVPKALYWDTPDPYHYVRLQRLGPEHDLLIAGGEDHRVGEEDDGEERFTALEAWTRARFPAGDRLFCWSGQVMEPSDGPGFIGRDRLDQQNVYLVTGDSGQGMTHGTIAGMLLSDLIAGRPNPWSSVYDPTRFPVQSTTWYQDAFDELWHYAELFTSGDVDHADAIDNGEGAVVRRGLEKLAVYRDERGVLHEFSAVCPHLGCVVAWNSTEAMWNCPCHGSRFFHDGTVMGGPTRTGLCRNTSGRLRSQQR